MTKKEKRERIAAIDARLAELYPDAECALKYGGDPWRLLVMARLSAQCTDARVNEVSQELFREFPNAESMAEGDISRIEELVKSKGFSECVAVLSGNGINIIVKNDEEALLPNQIAQIKEIAYKSAGVLPENVVIIEK